jgi:hypothetical protein
VVDVAEERQLLFTARHGQLIPRVLHREGKGGENGSGHCYHCNLFVEAFLAHLPPSASMLRRRHTCVTVSHLTWQEPIRALKLLCFLKNQGKKQGKNVCNVSLQSCCQADAPQITIRGASSLT